jgi:integrase/recombinase XerD
VDQSIIELRQDLARAGYGTTTREQYPKVAERLVAKAGKPIVAVTRDDVRAFVDDVVARAVSQSTIKSELAAIKFLFTRTLGRPEMVSFIRYPKVHSPLPTVLSLEEVAALISAVRKPIYRVIVAVLYGCGLRITEALALEVDDIDGARGVLRVRRGKGGKPREAKLSPELYSYLREYWAAFRPPAPRLFVSSRDGGLVRGAAVRKAIARAARDAGLRKRVTPHVLRHCYATHLLELGTDVRVVSALLGHASLSSTMRYARVTEKTVRAAPSPLELLPQRRR